MTEPDHDLDSLFAVARKTDVLPSGDLMARVLQDAAAAQPRPVQRPSVQDQRLGWFDRLAAVLGGGGALAGMSMAIAAGVWIGLAQPAPVAALTSLLLADASADSVDLLPESSALWGEQDE